MYGSGETESEVELCVPNEPKEKFAQKCETDFDCGYSQLEGKWSMCYEKECARAVEK